MIILNLLIFDLRLWIFDFFFFSLVVNLVICKWKKRLYLIKEVLVYLFFFKLDIIFKINSCYGDFICFVSLFLIWVSWFICIRIFVLFFIVIILLYGFICCYFCFKIIYKNNGCNMLFDWLKIVNIVYRMLFRL